MTFPSPHTPTGKLFANPQQLDGWGSAQEVGGVCPCTRTGDFQALTLVSLGFLARDTIASLPHGTNESLQLRVPRALRAECRKPCKPPPAKALQVFRWTCSCNEVTHREQLQLWADRYPEMPFYTILMQYMKLLKDMMQRYSAHCLFGRRELGLQRETVKAAYGNYSMVCRPLWESGKGKVSEKASTASPVESMRLLRVRQDQSETGS